MPSDKTPDLPAEKGRRAHGEILVARRYMSHGFLDASMRIFARNTAHTTADDWTQLVDHLLERGRVDEAVHACQTGGIPLPRQQLITLGDRQLRRKDVDGAIHYYELANADHDRWAGLVDVLTRLPGRELHAMEMAQRHLVPSEPAEPALALALAASA
ncbi:MAG TPA: hypothetical protein VMS22_25175 [Candidatus Eisenbacteria bacterium]|nr:hypothetical protein [Candidatus Eisenbacteria bacterium]